MKKLIVRLRRGLLKFLVPEVVWPRWIDLDGLKIQVRGAPYSFGIKSFLSKTPDMYEYDERQLCKRALNPGDRVLEMGGSIGILSAIISKLIGKEGVLLSIEADKSIVDNVNKSSHASGNFKMIHGYAFPIYNEIKLNVRFDNTLGGSLGGIVSYHESHSPVANNVLFLSTIEKLYNFRPDVLMIDIEGSEEIMCRYKPEFPQWVKKIIIELHPGIYGAKALEEIIDVIRSERFSLVESKGQVYLFERHPDSEQE